MFHFHFGQRCVYMGYSEQEHTRLCRLLEEQGIWYDTADGDCRANHFRCRTGWGNVMKTPRLYYIYVRTRDADLARELLRRARL